MNPDPEINLLEHLPLLLNFKLDKCGELSTVILQDHNVPDNAWSQVWVGFFSTIFGIKPRQVNISDVSVVKDTITHFTGMDSIINGMRGKRMQFAHHKARLMITREEETIASKIKALSVSQESLGKSF